MFRIIRRPKKKRSSPHTGIDERHLSKKLDENIQLFTSFYEENTDVIFRVYKDKNKHFVVIYLEGLTDTQRLEEQVLNTLLNKVDWNQKNSLDSIENTLPISNINKITTYSECMDNVLQGHVILLLDGEEKALSMGLTKFEMRTIVEPEAESTIRGSREGFTESITVNTSLVRRIIKDSALKMKSVHVGKYTKTEIIIAYMDGIADLTLIEEIENRLNRIKVDGVLESGYIEEFIEDSPYSPFPQMLFTERPDVVGANLLEGRAALIIDGTPFCLIAPVNFFSLFQSQEDFYDRFWVGSFVRCLRFMFLVISLFLPAIYVAITTFHQEMMPTPLLLSVASARESVPFPAIIEVLIMETAFEALREAGIRLPKQVGSAVSIVGALVIGQAAVQAGIVSVPMLIVVSITGIASFLVPRYSIGLTIRLLRFPIILLGGTLGLIGVILGFIIIIIHLSSLKSFGIPYLDPIGTLQQPLLKDTLIRAPLWKMDKRPHLTGKYNAIRQKPNLKPGPEHNNKE